jgi:hypothetical protein
LRCSAVESLGNQVGMRRQQVRRNAYRCVDIAAGNRQNQLRPSSPLWPVVTRRMFALLVLGVDVDDVNGIGELVGHLHSPFTARLQVSIYFADQVTA